MKDEIYIWIGGLAGAVMMGLIIAAYIIGFCDGDIAKIWTLGVAFCCFGITPIVWALEQYGWFRNDRSEDDETEDEDNAENIG